MRNSACALQRTEEQAGRMKFTPLQTKLKVYQAVIYLVAEFRRKITARVSENLVRLDKR